MVPEIPVKTVPVAFSLVFSGTLKSSRSRLEFREQNKHISFLFPKQEREREKEERSKKTERKKKKMERKKQKEVKMERERKK